MSLTPGTRIGVYQIAAQIGVGGMGEVYQATDSNLKRQVAIKVLPASVAGDPDRLARFQREAEVLAALNHPNIASIFGLEKAPDFTALVMELVEGEDLAQRIAHGAIPLDDALPIAKQIAEALEAAHEQGIVHRDLKPANIKVRADGTVKVLDFGLAKALDAPAKAGAPDLTQSPTITSPAMTRAGIILGTAAYMSPEQARGKTVDKRADIWAFGVVLYEMLAGQRPFKGEDTTDTIVAVASKEPDWSALPPGTPPSILKLLRRCLEKDRKRRLDSAAAVRLEIEDALTTAAIAEPATRARLPWTVAGILGVALVAALLALALWRPVPLLPETRVDIVTPATDIPTAFALSPDGRQIVFVASGDGPSRLWLRSLATMTTQPLMGTEEATAPFWAADSRAIGFFARGTLKRLDLGGGAPQTLAPAFAGRGGAWNADGVIVFAPSVNSHLMRVSATGGEVMAVTTLAAQQANHRWPHLLPDGRRFLFYAQGVPDATGIYLSALDGSAPTRLTPADSAGVYHPSGWLLWVRAGTLVAQRLDLTHGALTGETMTLAEGVTVDGLFRSAVSVAATGLVAYRTGTSRRQLTWLDRSGTPRGTIGDPDDSGLREPRASPNGRRVAVARAVQGNFDVWLLDDTRMSRLTTDGALDLYPVWSPDGTRIVFRSNRSGQGDLYQKLTSNTGIEERLVGSDQQKSPTSWSSDGRFLLYQSTYPQPDTDLWIVAMVGDPTPAAFLKTPFREEWGAFSPDGQWVAYQSDESGRMDIYVRPFVAGGAAGTAGGQWQVSTAGGTYPVWRPDGKELYYLNPAGAMMAAPITVTGSSLEPGAPMVLFSTRILGGGALTQEGRHYDVAPDGRFLINMVLDDAAGPITLLMNWRPETTK